MQNTIKKGDFSGSLGTTTKLHVTQSQQGLECNVKIDYCEVLARVERFNLQNQACDILSEKTTKTYSNNKFVIDENGEPREYFKHRVNHCLKHRITKKNGVYVFYNKKRKKAQYGNLQMCGSVWTCPVCANRITEHRRNEVKQGINNWRKQDGFVKLVTFTTSHHHDKLSDLLKLQKKAFKKFWETTKTVKYLKLLGYKARIVATEVTYGKQNGWHPHYHMLFFFERDINDKSLKEFLATAWIEACKKAGFKTLPSRSRGVDVRDGMSADEYIAKFGKEQKWGLDREITKSHVKKGRDGGYTPFDLLRMSSDDSQYRAKFKEYADAFKGSQQLFWSKGLKDLLNIKKVTDDEILAETEKESVEVKELELMIWNLIMSAKKRADYLHAVELDYIDKLTRADDLVITLAERFISKITALE